MRYLQENGEIKTTDEKLGIYGTPNVYLDDDDKLDLIEFSSDGMEEDDAIQIEFYYDDNGKLEFLIVNGYGFKLEQDQGD